MQEYQSCNTLPCPDLKKTTPWTPWTPVNISDNGGHYEQRFRYTCKARIPDPGLLEVGRQRIEMRYCSSDGSTGCSTDGEGQSVGERAIGWLLAPSPQAIPSTCLFSGCWSDLSLLPLQSFVLSVPIRQTKKQKNSATSNRLSSLWSRLPSALSEDQSARLVNKLPIHKADRQFEK